MTIETGVVFAILLLTIGLFVTDWLRLDLVAMMALLALMLTGVLTPKEALAGFADPLVLIIAGLFIVGAGLFQTAPNPSSVLRTVLDLGLVDPSLLRNRTHGNLDG